MGRRGGYHHLCPHAPCLHGRMPVCAWGCRAVGEGGGFKNREQKQKGGKRRWEEASRSHGEAQVALRLEGRDVRLEDDYLEHVIS